MLSMVKHKYYDWLSNHRTSNVRSTANHPLLQSMGNDKRHQRDEKQVPQR